MDANKLEKLSFIDYEIKRACGNCNAADIQEGDFGYCSVTTYEHEKHNEEESFLSINRFGVCWKHKWDISFLNRTGSFVDFLEE